MAAAKLHTKVIINMKKLIVYLKKLLLLIQVFINKLFKKNRSLQIYTATEDTLFL